MISKEKHASEGRPHDPYAGDYNLFQCGHQRTMCIVLTIMVVHDLQVKAVNALNAYGWHPILKRYEEYKVQSLGTIMVNMPQ